MTDAALLAAIVADPDDDTPRLVYADWLDENDRPDEAAFLRVQCAAAAAAADFDHPDYPDLILRDFDLVTWLSARHPDPPLRLPKSLQLLAGQNWWRTAHRGFPRFLAFNENGRSPTKAARTIGPALERAFDTLPGRAVVLRYLSVEQLAAVLRLPVFERVTTLKLELRLGEEEADEAARVVASAPLLRNLRSLALWFAVGEAGCEALGASPHLGRLDDFALTAAGLTPAAVRALVGGGWFTNLRAIELDGDPPDGFLDALAALPPFPRLDTLGLRRSIIPAASWLALARSAAVPKLASLDVTGGDMSGGRMAALARAKGFALRFLYLSRCGIGNEGAEVLAHSPQAGSLGMLHLTANGIGPAGAVAIGGSPRFTQLRHLVLAQNVVGVGGLRALGDNPALRGLRLLDLGAPHSANGMTTAHAREFLDAFAPTDLRHLDLSGFPVGVRGAKVIASPKFAGLTRLGLRGCHLGDGGAAAVIASPGLQGLVHLDLSANDLTTGVKPLADVGVMPRLAECDLSGNRVPPDLASRLARPGFRLG